MCGVTLRRSRRSESQVECDLPALVERLRGMPAATANRTGSGLGDPVNLVVIGELETLLSAFSGAVGRK